MIFISFNQPVSRQQSLDGTVNMVDACQRASANTVNVVMPTSVMPAKTGLLLPANQLQLN